MKKLTLSLLTAGLLLAGNVQAQTKYKFVEAIKAQPVAAGIVGTTLVAVAVSVTGNSSGSATPDLPDTEYVYYCEGEDDVDASGFCVGTEEVVTVTASGTGTTTILVPTTFTYAADVKIVEK